MLLLGKDVTDRSRTAASAFLSPSLTHSLVVIQLRTLFSPSGVAPPLLLSPPTPPTPPYRKSATLYSASIAASMLSPSSASASDPLLHFCFSLSLSR